MIPRYQRILFWTLLGVAVAMAVVLIRLRERAADRISGRYSEAGAARLPEPLPSSSAEESVTLLEASDADGAIAPVTRKLALPRENGARARVLLRQLLADYAAPESKHPLAAGPGVQEVFFMAGPAESPSGGGPADPPVANQTAIVNLTSAFVENHPSGIEPETLTLMSMIGTLHENCPAVGQVRFLVDGRRRETLAGHADLTRAYLAGVGEMSP